MGKLNVIFEDYVSTFITTKPKNTEANYIQQVRKHIAGLLDKKIPFKIKLRGQIICTENSIINLKEDRLVVNNNSYSYIGLNIEL